MRSAEQLTPMLRQYGALKRDQPDAILLFRMGDFYEMFYDDAREASRLLELTLTARGKGTDNVAPMCGFPYHQLDQYAAKLVRANRKVAVCDQVEDPRKAKGLVRREVVRVITPGTVNDPAHVEAKANLWMASLASAAGRLGAAFLDASTGEFLAWEAAPGPAQAWPALVERVGSFAPRELVVPEGFVWNEAFRETLTAGIVLTLADPTAFSPALAGSTLEARFGVATLDGFGLSDRPAAVAAGAGLLQYVQDTQRCRLEHVDRLLLHEPSRFLVLDAATRRNLEIERNARDGEPRGSLFHTLDATVTGAGGRLLRRWLLAPLLDPGEIARRQDAVQEWHDRAALRERARTQLEGIADLERILGRIVAGTAGARDLVALRASLERLPALSDVLGECVSELLRESHSALDPCGEIVALIARGIADDPPITLRDGGVIRDGFDGELDELRAIRRDGRTFIADIEHRERATTGIASLKVRFNKVFGYFLEVSRANLHLVPGHYERRQTIANGERYVTPELKEYEAKVLRAQDQIEELEQELFARIRTDVAREASRVKAVAGALAVVDVLAALAERAARHDYRRPRVETGTRLSIVAGRHPVVEQGLTSARFVPNDTALEGGSRAIAVLTGPNMGGKSTYLRQVALITLMAQTGSFVPAEQAEIGVVDRIFCRVGASDSLAEGQSTFMVEMVETANILHRATPRSLLLLDEIGRGTSTFDGLSIAWAVIEHLDSLAGGAPRCLFATHYHELTELAAVLDGVLNLRMAVRERGETVSFLHRVEPGGADRSYGIHVARLAGVPPEVVTRAAEILANIESDEWGRDGLPRRARTAGRRNDRREQPSLFGWNGAAEPTDAARVGEEVLEQLRAQDPERLTPLGALTLLAAWKRKLSGEEDP